MARLCTQVAHIPDTDAVKAELAGANHSDHTEGLRRENSKGDIGRTAVGSGPTMTRRSHGFYIRWGGNKKELLANCRATRSSKNSYRRCFCPIQELSVDSSSVFFFYSLLATYICYDELLRSIALLILLTNYSFRQFFCRYCTLLFFFFQCWK